jgi:L-lactate dehydrogenase complex protein LldG
VEWIDSMDALKNIFLTERSSGKLVINTIPSLGEIDEKLITYKAPDLEILERAYLQATLGVAENGSVWLYESQMINRLLPFICQHLVLVINKNDIVPTMHHAYQQIDVARDGFGVFLAGPSKTADIEQSLVIGAHGARTTTVYIIK